MNVSEFLPFETDVDQHGAYLYTNPDQLSSVLANARLSAMTFAALSWKDLRVLDLGCGDGTYTFELYDKGQVRELHGIDPAGTAIAAAKKQTGRRHATFTVHSGYELPYANDTFDVVHLRGVLHHMDSPRLALKEALRVAPQVFIIEPNGWNPVLKVIERVSPYHRAHNEKSYSPALIDHWLDDLSADVSWRRFGGLVPMFCPNPLARTLKRIEPLVEAIPIVRHISCAVYALVAQRRGYQVGQKATRKVAA